MGAGHWLGVATVCAAAVTCGVAAALVSRRTEAWRRWNRAVVVVHGLEEGCATPTEQLRRVAHSLTIEMFAGLASEGAGKVRMQLTCINVLRANREQGPDL